VKNRFQAFAFSNGSTCTAYIQEQNNRASEFSVKKMESEWKDTVEHRKLAGQFQPTEKE
jgi:hypothetical protein